MERRIAAPKLLEAESTSSVQDTPATPVITTVPDIPNRSGGVVEMMTSTRKPVPGPKFTPSTINPSNAILLTPRQRKKWLPHAVRTASPLRQMWNIDTISPARMPQRRLRTFGSEGDEDLIDVFVDPFADIAHHIVKPVPLRPAQKEPLDIPAHQSIEDMAMTGTNACLAVPVDRDEEMPDLESDASGIETDSDDDVIAWDYRDVRGAEEMKVGRLVALP